MTSSSNRASSTDQMKTQQTTTAASTVAVADAPTDKQMNYLNDLLHEKVLPKSWDELRNQKFVYDQDFDERFCRYDYKQFKKRGTFGLPLDFGSILTIDYAAMRADMASWAKSQATNSKKVSGLIDAISRTIRSGVWGLLTLRFNGASNPTELGDYLEEFRLDRPARQAEMRELQKELEDLEEARDAKHPNIPAINVKGNEEGYDQYLREYEYPIKAIEQRMERLETSLENS